MGRLRSRRLQPAVERVENRELLSAVIDIMATQGPTYHPAHPAVAAQAQSTSGVPVLSNPNAVPPIGPGPGTPTPAELARERFHATFNGPYYIGAPRFTSQSRIYYFRGLGGSTQFLHGDYQMAINMPKDPGGPILGAFYMQDRNINSGGAVGFDLTFDPTSLDRFGRPTRGTFVNDPNIYSGVDFNDTASGTLTIHYAPNAATVVLSGLLYNSGITNPLRNMDLQARGGRLVSRSAP